MSLDSAANPTLGRVVGEPRLEGVVSIETVEEETEEETYRELHSDWILFFSLRFILILQVTSTVASNASRQVKLNFDSHKVSYESLSKSLSFYVTILDFIKRFKVQFC